jgi:hypothetical protein
MKIEAPHHKDFRTLIKKLEKYGSWKKEESMSLLYRALLKIKDLM